MELPGWLAVLVAVGLGVGICALLFYCDRRFYRERWKRELARRERVMREGIEDANRWGR